MLYSHDWRTVPLQLWLSQQDTEVLSGHRPAAAAQPSRHVLPRPHSIPRYAQRCDTSAMTPPSTRTPCAAPAWRIRAHELRELLTEAVQTLADDPRAIKEYRAVHTTFFLPVPTQEAAAARLDLPFSTYRRHLARGTERICESLWDRELNANRLPTA